MIFVVYTYLGHGIFPWPTTDHHGMDERGIAIGNHGIATDNHSTAMDDHGIVREFP